MNGYKVISSIDWSKLTVNTELQTIVNDVVQSSIKQVLNTQEVEVRKRLIELGWTPPPPSARAHKCLCAGSVAHGFKPCKEWCGDTKTCPEIAKVKP